MGKERDEETGFYYIGARYYVSWIVRWIATDPINSKVYNLDHGQPQRNIERQITELSASPYEYYYDNPIRFTDLTGEQAKHPDPIANFAPGSATDNLSPSHVQANY